MKTARVVLFLALVLSSGCITQSYPGVVVGNPETDDPPAPGKPGDIEADDRPDPSQGPLPSEPPAVGENPSAPGPIQKDPEEQTQADADGGETPGSDRIGETPDETPSPEASRPDHVRFDDVVVDEVL